MDRKEILDTAIKCVCGEREQDYGTPENNFGLIACAVECLHRAQPYIEGCCNYDVSAQNCSY